MLRKSQDRVKRFIPGGFGSGRGILFAVLGFIVLWLVFGGIFYRNALNLGLVAVVCPAIGGVKPNDILSVDARAGCIVNHTQSDRYDCEPLPDHLMSMIENGGLIAHLKSRLAAQRKIEGTK